MADIVWRQPTCVTSQPANGAIVIGATPMPADTSAIASPRRFSNETLVAAMMGAKKAPAAYADENAERPLERESRLPARLARMLARPSSAIPVSTTRRGPYRSLGHWPKPRCPC